MKTGLLAAQAQAGRVLARQPWAWAPVVVVEVPLWVLGLGLLLLAGRTAGLSETERLRWLGLCAGGLATVWLLALLWEAAWLHLADRLLRGERVGAGDLLAGARARGPRFLGGRLLLGAVGLLLSLLALGFLLVLLSGGDLRRLSEVLGPGGLGRLRGLWAERGLVWLAGAVTLLVVTNAAREMLRLGAVYWRASLVAEAAGPVGAWRQALQFAAGRGWGLFGRAVLRNLVLGAAVLVPALVADLVLAVGGAGYAGVLRGLWLVATALALALARCWLTLGDLVYYRLSGGATGDLALASRGVRPRRPRLVRRRGDLCELTVASEPPGDRGRWQPLAVSERPPLASRPRAEVNAANGTNAT